MVEVVASKVVAMRDGEAEWVRERLGSDAATNSKGLDRVNSWYIEGWVSDWSKELTIEVHEAIDGKPINPDEGFTFTGIRDSVDEVAELIESEGFPRGMFE